MKCLILAAGYATRLYPLTENFPKPLLKVKGKTIIDWLIEDLERIEKIDEYIVISNHKYINHFKTWKNESSITSKLILIDDQTISNEERLGAVADIDLAIKKLKIDDDLLVLAGDNILDFSLEGFISYFELKNATCIMRYETNDINRLRKSANILIDENDKILDIIEKPENPISNLCCPPFYIYKKEDVSLVSKALSDGCKKDAPGSFICWLYDKRCVYAYSMPGKRYDIGTVDNYNKVNKVYNGIE